MFAKNLGGSSWLQRGFVRTNLEQTYDPQVPASDALNANLQQFAPIAMGANSGLPGLPFLVAGPVAPPQNSRIRGTFHA
jgi:hypothetical protein